MQKFKMACKSGRKVIFVKSCQYTLDTLWVENFDEIALSHTVKKTEANLCFCLFGKNSKWLPFLKRVKLFENCNKEFAKIPCGSKNSDEITLSRTVKEIAANLFLHFWQKFKMAAIFRESKFF